MSAYSDIKNRIHSRVKETNSRKYSKGDLNSLMTGLMNSPEEEFENVCGADNVATVKPVERFRESLKPVLKEFGVDGPELDKIQTVEFTKECAEATTEMVMYGLKGYLETGKKLTLPQTSVDEAKMSISLKDVGEVVKETSFIQQQEDGTYKSVPTGKEKTTKAHSALVAENSVPKWLVSEREI